MAEPKKLGELLVDAGLISKLDIDTALQAQIIFGGRLGTNLIDMGILDDETLAAFLSQQTGVPRATIESMENIPKEVLNYVPTKAAQRLCILPIEKKEDRLVVVMLDPSDERVKERLEANLKTKIECLVATEIEIRYFLEKYYGIPREMRHIQLMQQVLEKRSPKDSPVGDIDALSEHLDKHLTIQDSITFFFDEVGSLEKIPARKEEKNLEQYDLIPELMFILTQVDGISTLGDLLSILPLRRVLSLRAFTLLAKLDLIEFQEG